ncbi:hypothetical protein B0J13DRAFT_126621 [Dactylonectria estremocensis]|uniref:Uncharacterized protein n=1 Tax=Dactylonectria estremocensis TaxID=1079267 RepID=A0A9P9FF52_9HYPO|nr:hypothetical protein B0J13DRAFT_126621 [Dactylonectria estremocensis]
MTLPISAPQAAPDRFANNADMPGAIKNMSGRLVPECSDFEGTCVGNAELAQILAETLDSVPNADKRDAVAVQDQARKSMSAVNSTAGISRFTQFMYKRFPKQPAPTAPAIGSSLRGRPKTIAIPAIGSSLPGHPNYIAKTIASPASAETDNISPSFPPSALRGVISRPKKRSEALLLADKLRNRTKKRRTQ